MNILLISLSIFLSKERVVRYDSCPSYNCTEFAPYYRRGELAYGPIYWLTSDQKHVCVVSSSFDSPAAIGELIECNWRRAR